MGGWLPIGSTQPTGFTLNPGDNAITLTPTVDLKKLNPLSSVANVLQQLSTYTQAGGSPSVSIKADVTINIAGLVINDSEVKTLSMADLNLSGFNPLRYAA